MKFKIKVKITEVGKSLLALLQELVSDYDFSSKPSSHPHFPKAIIIANLNKYFKGFFFFSRHCRTRQTECEEPKPQENGNAGEQETITSLGIADSYHKI